MDNVTAAKLMLSCLDLTSLHDNDTDDTIKEFCKLADTPYGMPAALCVYSRFVPVVKRECPEIKTATVINFPQGVCNIKILEDEIPAAIERGADELDVVLPYKALLDGKIDEVNNYLRVARHLCNRKTMKLIIESGELGAIDKIVKATTMGIEAKVDFIKTSTGKTKISATPEATNAILETIRASGKNVGFKASGGIKKFLEAKSYLVLAQSIMGTNWIKPEHFRLGASSLLVDLLKTLDEGY